MENFVRISGKSANSFAESTGISQSFVSQCIAGEKNIGNGSAHRIAYYFNISIEDVYRLGRIEDYRDFGISMLNCQLNGRDEDTLGALVNLLRFTK